jgi:Flp pilus assembly protein TadG
MRDDKGSIAPLGIGLMAILIALIFTLVCVNSVYLSRHRLTSAAEFAALAEASHGTSAVDFLELANYPTNYFVEDDSSADHKTTEVTICTLWVAPVPFVPVATQVKVCGRGAARAG